MKKQVLGMFAALFVFAALLPAWACAADTVYAILYDDGTLVFQNGDTPESGKTVSKTYAVDLTAVYTENSPAPWYEARESIKVVSFADKVSPTSTARWFWMCSKLERVDNIQNLDTSHVTSMHSMFSHCSGLTTLDVSGFDTSKVTNMWSMFYWCSGLTELNVSGFNTANVTNMWSMFEYCSSLTTLDISGFDTSKVTNMCWMFRGCSGLTTLDVSGFDTAKVTNMESMFNRCSGLTALNVSGFETAKVTNMSHMFEGCSGLTALDISKFDTSKVTNMSCMFDGCSGLTALDVSGFNTANVTDMSFMFHSCAGLKTLKLSDWNTSNVTTMANMFSSCANLTELTLRGFDTSNVTDMSWMFARCAKLTTICTDKDFQLAPEAKSGSMFYNCTALTGGNGTKFDSSHIDAAYARIDTASAPGYFTDKPGSVPAAYAITAVTPNKAAGILSATLTNPGTVTVAVSYFDANGQFMSANLLQGVQADAGTVTLGLSAGARKVSVMLFDNTYRPVCERFEANID